jgi:hypothetical protein
MLDDLLESDGPESNGHDSDPDFSDTLEPAGGDDASEVLDPFPSDGAS